MLDSFGAALRTMRDAAGLSLAALANRSHVSKSLLGHLETGARLPTVDVAEDIDTALRGGGVLVELAAMERGGGDTMRRRALLSTIAAASTLGTIGGPHALGDLVRHGLMDAAGADEDWDAAVEDAQLRLVCDPSPLFGSALLTNLMLLRQQLQDSPTAGLFRASAGLGQVYGLWLGNQSALGGAHHWYRSATVLADRSGDVDMMAWTRGRSAARGIYEGWTVAKTMDTAAAALAVTSRPTFGDLEAHAARVHVHALTGDIRQGRRAVADMEQVAEHLIPPSAGAGPAQRAVFVRAFLECRAGDPDSAEQACEQAETALAGLPTWLLETRIYRARALVASGNVCGGLAYALRTIEQVRHDVRVIAVAVRDVCCAAPADYRGDDLAALWRRADPSPGPWETLAR